MKRKIVAALAMAMLMCTACSGKEPGKATAPGMKSVNDVLAEQMAAEDAAPLTVVSDSGVTVGNRVVGTASSRTWSTVDIDLTTLSSTLIYSEVYNITTAPDSYTEKVIKMSGFSSAYYDEASGETYYACIIQDAAACCARGIEYVMDGAYPEEGAQITITGVFRPYVDVNGDTYYHIEESEVVING